MKIKNLTQSFLRYCSTNKFKKNSNQIQIIEQLVKFYTKSFSKQFFSFFFEKKNEKLGFYLSGDVGVGKTMLLNFFYDNLEITKKRLHFNEFMIDFHDFAHNRNEVNKNNSIEGFVKKLKKKYELIYFDEFQVTNIVDAMILGKLFEKIFKENIKVIFSSNIEIKNLYDGGLQREQFIPFISIMKNLCVEKKLFIEEDYRKSSTNTLERFFYPLDEQSNFKINQLFRKLTKKKRSSIKELIIKGRSFLIKNYFEKIARFNFNDLCDQNIGAEDYIRIAEVCNFIVIENIPQFNDENINKQQRFITLIDILYEKKISLMVSSETNLENFGSSRSLVSPFKRTLSRLYELTSLNINYD
tara:strand:+ start:694 stop:1761 length:1068 start_codon:yes stop_codon:yes gene_type:complete